jgi:hypothetical protein
MQGWADGSIRAGFSTAVPWNQATGCLGPLLWGWRYWGSVILSPVTEPNGGWVSIRSIIPWFNLLITEGEPSHEKPDFAAALETTKPAEGASLVEGKPSPGEGRGIEAGY